MTIKNFNLIPTINMRDFHDASRAKFITQLIATCHQVGFFYLENHNIPTTLTQRVMLLTQTFFDLPQQEKDLLNIHHSPHYRGYGKLNAETTLGIPDYKETYDLGLDKQPYSEIKNAYEILQGWNQWPQPPLHDEFRTVINEYMRRMMLLGQNIMLLLAEGLGISSSDFIHHFNPDNTDAFAMLRLLHYPPSANPHNQFGVGPHVDAGCLVFLLQDEVGGLQVQNHDGDWIDAPPRANSFIVNIGQMLQVWTNHYFTATPHRVLNHHSKHRYSAPFFFEPNLSAVVSPQAVMQESHPHSHSEIVYGEHMLNIFKRSFVKQS